MANDYGATVNVTSTGTSVNFLSVAGWCPTRVHLEGGTTSDTVYVNWGATAYSSTGYPLAAGSTAATWFQRSDRANKEATQYLALVCSATSQVANIRVYAQGF